MKTKSYQMPRSFVCNVLLLIEHLREHYELDPNARSLFRSLEAEIDAKIEAIRIRDAFSRYKTAPAGSPEREKLRKNYLELAQIHKDWQSPTEDIFV